MRAVCQPAYASRELPIQIDWRYGPDTTMRTPNLARNNGAMKKLVFGLLRLMVSVNA